MVVHDRMFLYVVTRPFSIHDYYDLRCLSRRIEPSEKRVAQRKKQWSSLNKP